MKKLLLLIAGSAILFANTSVVNGQKVEFRNLQNEKKIEVLIDGKLFTAFIYPDDMEKQSLYPILSASGISITRGYPMQPKPFERTDHPHHVGLWFNFGNVNGLDFWNNSFDIKAEDKSKYGTVKFDKIVSMKPEKGELITNSRWVDINDNVLLSEETKFIFSDEGDLRTIERQTKLTAKQQVTFTENKEGLLGIRVDRAFEEPATKPEKFLDANGNETEVPVLNNDGVNGVYRNAEGNKGGDVWSKRSKWVALKADKEGEIITIVILDNPKNPNYPGWSHARGYGLFAHNNLAGRAVDKNAEAVKIVLKPGESISFKHMIIIGGDLSDARINELSGKFK
jgi:hypothetical protein